MITPLRDGMNLVAKEYCACNIEEDGVLILSEFAGCAHQLKLGALIVNPYDREQVADAVFQAVMMPVPEKKERMHKLRDLVREYDIYKWLDLFLDYDQEE
jgi:trehalose 6-phosphate synthase